MATGLDLGRSFTWFPSWTNKLFFLAFLLVAFFLISVPKTKLCLKYVFPSYCGGWLCFRQSSSFCERISSQLDLHSFFWQNCLREESYDLDSSCWTLSSAIASLGFSEHRLQLWIDSGAWSCHMEPSIALWWGLSLQYCNGHRLRFKGSLHLNVFMFRMV